MIEKKRLALVHEGLTLLLETGSKEWVVGQWKLHRAACLTSSVPLSPPRHSLLQVIYMARNPKDLVVSYYQFHRSLRTMSYRGTFQEFCRRFMNDKCKCLRDVTAGVLTAR